MGFLDNTSESCNQYPTLQYDDKNRLSLGKEFGNEYLTHREVEILKYILQGYTAKRAGIALGISYRTVEFYTNTLKLKLQCENKSDLISACCKLGVLKVLID